MSEVNDLETVKEFLKLYKWTSIYSAIMLTLILVVFVVSELAGG